MPGFVVCAACGSHIMAGRGWCVRCGEIFEAAPESAVGTERPQGLSQRHLIVAGAVLAVVALATAVIVWQTRSPASDRAARPATPLVATAPPATAPDDTTAAQPSASQAPLESATFIDSTRKAAAAFTTGGFESARVSYEEALARRPDDPEILNNLGQALVRLGRVPDAFDRFERAVALSPQKWNYRFNLAHAAGQLGQWERAVAEYREAERLFPTDYATVFNLAMALHRKGDEQAAIPEFQKAIQLAPGEDSFHVSLAVSLEAAGRVADAITEFRRYLALAPDAPDAAQVKAHVDALVAAQPAS